MKNLKNMFMALAFLAGLAVSLAACSSSESSEGGGGGDNPNPPAPSDYTYANMMGVVTNNWGGAIEGVKVINGTQSASTDANGVFKFDRVIKTGNRTIMIFQKDGYVDICKAMPTEDGSQWRISMIQKGGGGTAEATFTSNDGATISVDNSRYTGRIRIDLPDGYKDENGNAYTGSVKAQATFINPDDQNFNATMPGGDLAAENKDGEEVQLVSYGMVGVELTSDDGKKLQLADGKTATLSFPIPSDLAANAPASMPLWAFDESRGLWIEEGTATKEGDRYVGEVSHFSWWNLDYPYSRATLKVTVQDANGHTIPYIPVDIDKGQRVYTTNQNGYFECYIPSGTAMDLRVKSEDYLYHGRPETVVHIDAQAAGDVKEVTIVLPAAQFITGTVNTVTGSNKICKVTLSLPGFESATTYSDLYGQFKMSLPDDYIGVASVIAVNTVGDEGFANVTLDGTDKNVNINIISDTVESGSPGTFTLIDENDERIGLDLRGGDNQSTNINIISNRAEGSFYWYGESGRENQNVSFSLPDSTFNGTDTYNNVSYSYYHYLNSGTETLNVSVSGATAKLTRDGGKYNVQFTGGTASYYGSTTNNTYKQGTAELTIALDIHLLATEYLNTTPDAVRSLLPDHMPYLEGKTMHALVIHYSAQTESGGVVCYTDPNITEEEVNNLQAQATATLGAIVNPLSAEEAEGDMKQMYAPAWLSGNKFLSIMQSPWYDSDYEKGEFHFDPYIINSPEVWNAKVTIKAYNNIKVPITELIMR